MFVEGKFGADWLAVFSVEVRCMKSLGIEAESKVGQ